MREVKKVVLTFHIEDNLSLDYGHKLRGYISNKYGDILFHHHNSDGSLRYKYPLIQYKIIDGCPTIVGLGDGASLIVERFMEIDRLVMGEKTYLNPETKLSVFKDFVEVNDKLSVPQYKYTFLSPWIALNQNNYNNYAASIRNADKENKVKFFENIIVGNILSMAKTLGIWLDKKIIAGVNVHEVPVNFKGKKFIGFSGEFYSNAHLPDFIGLGKLCSRGFGTIKKKIII